MKRLLLVGLLCLPLSGWAEIYDDMYQAIKNNDAATVREILQQGLDPDTSNKLGDTLIMTAIRDNDDAVVDVLLPLADMKHTNSLRETPLMLAAYFGKNELIEKMLGRGAAIDGAGNWSPLSYAAFNGHWAIAKQLLRYGAKVDTVSENGTTALMVAARNGHAEMVKLLLQYGANPVQVNMVGQNAVSFALQNGNTDIAEMLQEAIRQRTVNSPP